MNPANESLVGECSEGVVHRLTGDRTDFASYGLGQLFCRGVRGSGHGFHDRQTLCGDLQAAVPKLLLEVLLLDWIMSHRLLPQGVGHQVSQTEILDSVKNSTL